MSNFADTIAEAVVSRMVTFNPSSLPTTDLAPALIVTRDPASLPATAQTPYFRVSGKVRIFDIVGEVTTVIQTQTCNAKLVSNPTVGADVDICAVKDITAAAVGTMLNITGTFATAMVQTTSGAYVAQASPTVVAAGTIDLSTSATNTGATKWTIRYQPIDPGARITAI